MNEPMNPPAEASQDDRTMALIAHLSGIIAGFIGPLVIWLINKDKPEKSWLVDQSKEALNFQITVAIAYVVGMILTIVLIGFLVCLAVLIGNVVLCIMAGMKANEGVAYRYPFAIRLIK
jgi:uncharacterized Tic20 family protein